MNYRPPKKKEDLPLSESPRSLVGEPNQRARTPYRKAIAKKMVELYMEGFSFTKICERPDMPSLSSFNRWLANNKEFKTRIMAAREARREARAIHYEDKAIEAAESAVDKDDAPAARLRFDAYKWGAEVNDPSKYGKKVTHAGDSGNPIKFVISTGFPEPNEFQKHPELGQDGLIKKNPVALPLIKDEDS